MDDPIISDGPSKSIQSLPKSISTLLGFKKYLTPNWAESVCRIIKDLPSNKQSGGSSAWSAQSKEMDSAGYEDAEMDSSLLIIRGELASLNAHLSQLSLTRRQALNDYLDLKGNIRVFCRVRPFLPDERCYHTRSIITTESSSVFLKITENKSKQYSFDKVFNPQSTQEEVFSEVEPVIKSALDGYNVCIFAYGQTGSGKTYTMEGRPDSPGVVSRGIETLFKQALESSYKFLFTFSMLEIYMGGLRDLLAPQSTKPWVPKTPCLSIQMHSNGNIEIENLTTIKVTDFKQVKRLYKLGTRFRSTASTMSNSTSSRSHCLIRIALTCLDAPERRRETNKIWMIDLGGSERLLKTQARGRRLEEGKAINLSLSALGDVISALQSKKHHVPYRNSKLTQVLKDSLGSDSKTLMLVHVSPKEEDMCETVCSLGFAKRVKSTHLGSEERTELRDKKEAAMAELLQKVKHIESEHQDVKRNIEKLHERHGHLTRSETLSEGHLEASFSSTEGLQSHGANDMKNLRDYKGNSTSLPRFMRQTICSQRKTNVDYQTSASTRKKPPIPSKRKSASVYAESVTSQPKGGVWQSDFGSECSISTISCSNQKYSADDGIECSQCALECETKRVIFPEQDKSPRSLMTSSHGSVDETENGETDKTGRNKQLIIENWLNLQATEQTSTCIHWSKRVLAIPVDKVSEKCSERNNGIMICKAERQHCFNNRGPGSASKEHKNDFIKEEINFYRTVREDMTKEKFYKSGAMDEKRSFLDGSSSHITESENQQDENLDQTSQNFKVTPEQQEDLIKAAKASEVGGDSSIMQRESPMSHDNTILETRNTGDLCGSQRHKEEIEETSLCSMSCRKSLFMDTGVPTLDQNKAALEDPTVPVINLQEEKHSFGTQQILWQTVQMLWASTLMGLGIDNIEFGHDFFYGLVL